MTSLSKLQLFANYFRSGVEGQSCDVPSGTGQAGDEPGSHRVDDGHHDDGDRLARVLGRVDQWRRRSHDDMDLQTNQISGEVRQPFVSPLMRVRSARSGNDRADLRGEHLLLVLGVGVSDQPLQRAEGFGEGRAFHDARRADDRKGA